MYICNIDLVANLWKLSSFSDFIHYIASYVCVAVQACLWCVVYIVIYIHIVNMKSRDIIMILEILVMHITNFIIKIFT